LIELSSINFLKFISVHLIDLPTPFSISSINFLKFISVHLIDLPTLNCIKISNLICQFQILWNEVHYYEVSLDVLSDDLARSLWMILVVFHKNGMIWTRAEDRIIYYCILDVSWYCYQLSKVYISSPDWSTYFKLY
jgi:hypothetical protein